MSIQAFVGGLGSLFAAAYAQADEWLASILDPSGGYQYPEMFCKQIQVYIKK